VLDTPILPLRKIRIATQFGLENATTIALAARKAEVPLAVASALFEKESMGRNIWGNDRGGVFEPLPFGWQVTKAGYEIFEHYVVVLGYTSNGCGPAQITWRGFFPDMRAKGLKPWRPYDNMLYGLQLLHDYKNVHGATWEDAGTKYNGARSYGIDFAEKIREWRTRYREI
jgi:hypothetical protein